MLYELDVGLVQEIEELGLQVGLVELTDRGLSCQRLPLLDLEEVPGSQSVALKADSVEFNRTSLQAVLVLSHHSELLDENQSLSLEANPP